MPSALSDIYQPAEDTFLLADMIVGRSGNYALDIGCGSGYLAKILEKSFDVVVGTDLSFRTLTNQSYKINNSVCCNASDALLIPFDLIVCNMPYIPSDEILDITTDGGKDGIQVPLEIIKSAIPNIAPDGSFLFLVSSLTKYSSLIDLVNSVNLNIQIIGKKKLFYETLLVFEVTHSSA